MPTQIPLTDITVLVAGTLSAASLRDVVVAALQRRGKWAYADEARAVSTDDYPTYTSMRIALLRFVSIR